MIRSLLSVLISKNSARNSVAIRGAARTALIENLEQRQLMAGVLTYSLMPNVYDGGMNLNLYGSSSADNLIVKVTNDPLNEGIASVKVTFGIAPTQVTKSFKNVRQTHMYLNGGADKLVLSGVDLSDSWHYVSVDGGNGNDRIYIQNFDGAVYVNGGEGVDTIDASKAFGPYAIIGVHSMRQLYGGNGNDAITGSNANDGLYGDAGDDYINGGAGDDYINGGIGSNKLYGGAGDDMFMVWASNGIGPWNVGGTDMIYGGSDDDTVSYYYDTIQTPSPIFSATLSSVEMTYTYGFDYSTGGKG